MGDTPVSYISNCQAAFRNPPPGFEKARPHKSKLESVKTNYSVSITTMPPATDLLSGFEKLLKISVLRLTVYAFVLKLGETATRYESAAMSQFTHQ